MRVWCTNPRQQKAVKWWERGMVLYPLLWWEENQVKPQGRNGKKKQIGKKKKKNNTPQDPPDCTTEEGDERSASKQGCIQQETGKLEET